MVTIWDSWDTFSSMKWVFQYHAFTLPQGVCVSYGCCNKLPHPGGLSTTDIFFSWSWRPEVQNQSVSKAMLSLKALGRICPMTFSYLQVLWVLLGISLARRHILQSPSGLSPGVLSRVSPPLLVGPTVTLN